MRVAVGATLTLMPRAKITAAEPTYREAYATLSRIVADLESGSTDLDRILPLLDEARTAYEICQSRIAAVAGAVQGAEWLAPDSSDSDSSEAFTEETDAAEEE